MKQIDQIINQVITNQPRPNQSLQQPSLSATVKSEVSYTAEDKLALNDQLGACLVAQRTYGKQGEDMPATMRVFLSDLADYPMPKIVEAVKKWRKTSPEFPTPADILAILAPAPKLDKSVYIALSKRRSQFSEFSAEFDYIKAYEKQELEKVRLPKARAAIPDVRDVMKAGGQ